VGKFFFADSLFCRETHKTNLQTTTFVLVRVQSDVIDECDAIVSKRTIICGVECAVVEVEVDTFGGSRMFLCSKQLEVVRISHIMALLSHKGHLKGDLNFM
jgi:hypothetical protein